MVLKLNMRNSDDVCTLFFFFLLFFRLLFLFFLYCYFHLRGVGRIGRQLDHCRAVSILPGAQRGKRDRHAPRYGTIPPVYC